MQTQSPLAAALQVHAAGGGCGVMISLLISRMAGAEEELAADPGATCPPDNTGPRPSSHHQVRTWG